MDLSKDILHNWICDLRKKEVSQFDKAKLIKQYMEQNNLSIRKFAAEFGFPKSTIEDWLLWIKIEPEQYNKLTKKGIAHTDIYRTLRNHKTSLENVEDIIIKQNDPSVCETELDLVLWKFTNKLKKFMNNYNQKSNKTLEMIYEVKQIIEVLENKFN